MAHFEDYTWVSRLLGKALRGTLAEEEEERLHAWRSADASHEALYGRVVSGGFWAAKRAEWEKADRVAAYLQVRERCRSRRRLRTWRRVSGVAAAVLLAVGVRVVGGDGEGGAFADGKGGDIAGECEGGVDIGGRRASGVGG